MGANRPKSLVTYKWQVQIKNFLMKISISSVFKHINVEKNEEKMPT